MTAELGQCCAFKKGLVGAGSDSAGRILTFPSLSLRFFCLPDFSSTLGSMNNQCACEAKVMKGYSHEWLSSSWMMA